MVTRRFAGGARSWAVGAALAAGLVLSACSSSGGSGGGTTAAAGGGATGSASGGASSITVVTRSGPLGTYLTDGSGKTLYMFASDTPTKSTCTGSCLSFWPPLDGKATAGSGVTASQLGTITGTNGAAQVTYAGHPLYHYAADKKPGDVKGQGSNQSGALWWILTPSGAPIESKAPAGGGGGY
jgi:predicted lipoprotein with Yx(FWY)xxD motif